MDYIHCMFHQRSGLLDQQSMGHNDDNAHLLNCIDLLSMSLSMWSPSFVDQSIYLMGPTMDQHCNESEYMLFITGNLEFRSCRSISQD